MSTAVRRLVNLSVSYAVGDILTRGLSFLLVPLYTRFLPSSDYGILGLAITMSSFLTMALAFAGRNIVMRFYYQFDDEGRRRRFLGSF